MSDDPGEKSQLLVYRAESGAIKVEVHFENETAWLTQAQIAQLFQTTIPDVNLHLRNIFEEGELVEAATIKEFLIVRAEGELLADSVIKIFLTTAADGKNPGRYYPKAGAETGLPFQATHKKFLSVRGLTPTALRPPAQGCEVRATLGRRDQVRPTPKGLWPKISAA